MQFRTALPAAIALGCLGGVMLARAGTPTVQASEATASNAANPLRSAPESARWDLPVVWNAPVAKFVHLFESKQTDRVALYLKRAGRYEGMIRGKLRERGLPEDLLYLSMVESGFNPTARSHAQAVGLWQFMATTARGYGLRVDRYVDERRHPEKSTDAALRYLEDLYERFGSWNLAAAAYNAGHNRVARIMREELGTEQGEEADFWRIRHRLPRDTRDYVPLILAFALVGEEPEKYGLQHVERWLPVQVDTVEVPGATRLARVARAVGVSASEMRVLNPHLVRGVTPPGEAYPVYIPAGRTDRFVARFEAERGAVRLTEE